jgi:hypothetical protein
MLSVGRGSLSNKVRCTHEHCQGVDPCCSQTCLTREDRCTPDVARSSSTDIQPATRVSMRTQTNTRLDNAPRTRERRQGRRRRARQSPTYPKKRLARNVVSERHHARGASERTCRQPRSTSCTATGTDISDSHCRCLRRRRRKQRPTPSSLLRVFDTRMAIDRARPPSVRHRARHAAMLRRSLQARAGPMRQWR